MLQSENPEPHGTGVPGTTTARVNATVESWQSKVASKHNSWDCTSANQRDCRALTVLSRSRASF
eukprot:1708792-Pyramimonas_sp.AAC.1